MRVDDTTQRRNIMILIAIIIMTLPRDRITIIPTTLMDKTKPINFTNN